MLALSDMQLARQMDLAFKASYFIGRYYFSVNTRRKREDYGLLPDQEISIDIQHKLREDNIISLFHEYIHYIHEISTVVGNLYLNLDLVQKSIFSRYFSPDLKSSTHNGINNGNASDRRMNAESYFTKEVLNGSSTTDAKITKVLGVEYQTTPFYLVGGETIEEEIQVPILNVEKHEQGKFVIEKVNFGKFFIYEGLAYELDRELDKQLRGLSDIRDDNAYSEYTVLRLLANYVYPGVNKYTFLCLASLSLSFMDIGLTFIRLLEKTRAAVESGKKLDDVIHQHKKEISFRLHQKKEDFFASQDEIVGLFNNRMRLHAAFLAIAAASKSGYSIKIQNPTFEVDLILSGQYARLAEIVPVCDYMYTFEDEDEWNRDLFGTASFSIEVGEAFRVLIAFDHYQKKHLLYSTSELEVKEKVKCPLFACCTHPLRKDQTQICAEKPWRMFEISSYQSLPFCWYGQAVGEFKGHSAT
jgi:hypothetical protein